MQVSNANNVKIYSITSASRSAIPEWQVQRNKNKLKYDQAWRNRIELIQDFQFPEASNKIRVTPDGKYIMATGVYKPQIRVFDLANMSMKFERHTDAENVTFELLTSDWTKSIHLQSDRTVELHTHYGMHHQTRVPKFGRDLAYNFTTCDALIGGACNEVWRLNLEQGRFMSPLATNLPEVNVTRINPAHQLFGFGGTDGKIEFWHPSEKKCIGVLNVAKEVIKKVDSSLMDGVPEITCLEFGSDGLSVLAGTSTGQVLLYDLRRPEAIIFKDHQYGFPIKSLIFHSSGKILSTDTKIVKLWDRVDGKVFTNIEAPHDINDTCVFDDSGLVMLANEAVQMQSYYLPALGPAPKWCPFLDNLTEELEENPTTTVYDDYKFVTRKELQNLSLDHLIGTNVLKAYMHGFFVDLRLYEKAKAIANPFEFDEYRKRMVQKKIEEKRASRISAQKNLPKVNRAMATELLGEEDSDDEKKSKKKRKDASILQDNRFSGMFQDPEFEVDETTLEYKLHHPSESQAKLNKQKFEPVQESESESDAEPTTLLPKMYQLKDGYDANETLDQLDEKEVEQSTAFEERLAELQSSNADKIRTGGAGNMSITFKPGQKKRTPKVKSDTTRRSAVSLTKKSRKLWLGIYPALPPIASNDDLKVFPLSNQFMSKRFQCILQTRLRTTKVLYSTASNQIPNPGLIRQKAMDHPEPSYENIVSGYSISHHKTPFETMHGDVLPEYQLAYESWGKLNEAKDNVILLHTGLSGSSHAKSHPRNTREGWWEKFIGPGLALDTDKFHIICTNVLGGCYGSTGPSSVDPRDGERYATRFPVITLFDMIKAQFEMLDRMGIKKLHASVGSSMGGMQSLTAAVLYPERVGRLITISGAARSHPYSIAMRFAQRQVLMSDPNWNYGFYYSGVFPHIGMKLARQIATITYRSGPEWEERFGRMRADPTAPRSFDADYLIESYLNHQGERFCLTYDPNSLLYLSKAMDMFDLSDPLPELSSIEPKPSTPAYATSETLVHGLRNVQMPTLVLGVQSDLLFPIWQQKEIADSLKEAGNGRVTYYELDAKYGHDTFLIDTVNVGSAVKGHLEMH